SGRLGPVAHDVAELADGVDGADGGEHGIEGDEVRMDVRDDRDAHLMSLAVQASHGRPMPAMPALPAALLAPRADGVAELRLGPRWAGYKSALAYAPSPWPRPTMRCLSPHEHS